MKPGGMVEQEEQADHIGQGTVALDIPADLAGTPEFPGAHRQPGEVGLLESGRGDLLGQHLPRPGTGLVDGVGKGRAGDLLEPVLGREVVPTFGLDLPQPFPGSGDLLVHLLQRGQKHPAEPEAHDEQDHDSTDEPSKEFLALVHWTPFFQAAVSRDTSSIGRGGGFTLWRSILSLAGTRTSTLERNS